MFKFLKGGKKDVINVPKTATYEGATKVETQAVSDLIDVGLFIITFKECETNRLPSESRTWERLHMVRKVMGQRPGLGVVMPPVIPTTGRQRQEDPKFEIRQ